MGTALIVIHLLLTIFLVFVILLQPGKGDGGIGFGGSSSQSIFGSRGAGNFLTKTTGICAALFLVTSFVLTRARIHEHNRSVISGEKPGTPVTGAPPSANTVPPPPDATPAPDGKTTPLPDAKRP